ncbi:hypothetical protein EBR21_06450 [bacterium]|nr:hypothetical protein [bacterium]
MRLVALLAALLTMTFTAKAQACDLPICDVAAELKIMEGKNQAYRFQLVSKLRQEFSREKAEAKLNNLLEFARSAVELIQKLNDEEYVVREAKALRDQSVFLLVQWVWRDCKRLSSGYSELAGETQRFAALDFFLRKVEAMKDRQSIRELGCFARNAEAISMDLKDSDYVARQALQLGSALSTQLLEVVNGWEGVFLLTSIEGPLSEDLDQLRLVLFSTGGELGVVASLSHPTLRPTIFQKLTFNESPQWLGSRQSFASAVPSVLQLKFNESFDAVEGTMLDPLEFKKIHLSARRLVKVEAFSKAACSEEELTGIYRTQIGDVEGQFTIEKIGPRQLAAVFASDDGVLRLPFSFGRYNDSTGRLTFINMQMNVPLGWRLIAERNSSGKCEISGWGLSTITGGNYLLRMKKK